MEAGCGAPHIHTPAASAIGLSNRIRASTERSDIRKAHLWDPSLSLSHDPAAVAHRAGATTACSTYSLRRAASTPVEKVGADVLHDEVACPLPQLGSHQRTKATAPPAVLERAGEVGLIATRPPRRQFALACERGGEVAPGQLPFPPSPRELR
eukprot:CAMPEP_0195611342 /NCGR_PEP_ID=MMETSP0815-20121206/10291_1 /TAXON_ID=97485 /ORGANISM="Prymnesium parvum, Strain Texoma1" /LENGTH=152 /DNA_ID=CAMNT_0040751391 /DNA_START=522 /DNA_END=977 /DNA_ORIENTATION=-